MKESNSIVAKKNEKTATLKISGRFDFTQNQAFRAAATDVCNDPAITLVDLDFSATTYLDSSALGMMLLLREKATSLDKQIEITNCNDFVKQILDVANFGKVFTIKETF